MLNIGTLSVQELFFNYYFGGMGGMGWYEIVWVYWSVILWVWCKIEFLFCVVKYLRY